MDYKDILKDLHQIEYKGKPTINFLRSLPVSTAPEKKAFIKEVFQYHKSLGMGSIDFKKESTSGVQALVRRLLVKCLTYNNSKQIVANALKDIVEVLGYEYTRKTLGVKTNKFIGFSGKEYIDLNLKTITLADTIDILRGYNSDNENINIGINKILEMDSGFPQRANAISMIAYILDPKKNLPKIMDEVVIDGDKKELQKELQKELTNNTDGEDSSEITEVIAK